NQETAESRHRSSPYKGRCRLEFHVRQRTASRAGGIPAAAPKSDVYGLGPSGKNSSFCLLAPSSGAAAFQGGIGCLPGSYNDSIGSHTVSTRSVKRSPINRSVIVPLRRG